MKKTLKFSHKRGIAMKKILKRTTALVMSILMMLSCCYVALAAESNAVVANAVYDEAGKRIGFDTITVGDTVYYDIYDGYNTLDGISISSFYKRALTEKYGEYSPLDIWSYVADNVFRIGGKKYGYNWEFGDYDTWYGNNSPTENGDIDLRYQFSLPWTYSTGALESNCVRASGLQLHSSLNNVQNAMLEQIVDVCGERNDATDFKEDVIKFCTPNGEGLELLKDTTEQPVLAQVITNQYDGGGFWRHFSSFGIAFYDFKLTPIIEEGLEYISAADNYDSVEDAFMAGVPGVTYKVGGDKAPYLTYIQNPTASTASVSSSTSKSTSYSVSNSFSESSSHSFSESVSVSGGIKFSDAFKLNVGVSFTASQAISTAYSESTSLSESYSTSSSVNVSLPPYTEVGIKHTSFSEEQTLEYDCPVAITYKVAIFGMNAQYDQNTGTGNWSVADFEQGSICVGFGTNSGIGGKTAGENLYNRIKEKNTAFELSYGNVTGMFEVQVDGSDPTLLTYIDWNSSAAKHDLTELSEIAAKCIPMSSIGGIITAKADYNNTEITQIYPMYDLKRIRFEGNGAYTLGIGGKLDLNTVNVIGLNKFDREYYGFLPRMGTWHLCDENGNDLPAYEAGKGITIEPTPTTQTIIANELGDYYLRFDIDEKFYTKAVDRKTFITNDDLEMTAIMKLSVTDTGNNHTCRPGGWITYIPANCVVEGERYKNCLTCSKRMATEIIPKTDHISVTVTEPATCTADGSKTTTCVTCKAVLEHEVLPAKGHGSTIAVTTIAPTCINTGEKTLYCADCSMIIGTQEIAKTGHDNGVWKIDFEATPEHEGQMTKYCSICNAALESKSFAYHTHSFTAWGKNNDGTHARSCYLCSFTETANCNYDETAVPATCLTDGQTVYTCSDCGYKYSEINEYAPGHTWGEWTDVADGNHQATCTVCQTKEKTVHIFVDYIPNNDATKDSDGTKTATCAVCTAKDTVVDEGTRLEEDAEHNDCTHICHKTGIMGFLWKILRIFWSVFKMNPVCECGAAHY